jgi:hypothetical protein
VWGSCHISWTPETTPRPRPSILLTLPRRPPPRPTPQPGAAGSYCAVVPCFEGLKEGGYRWRAYPSDSVYDDLAWAGAWLFKATGGSVGCGRGWARGRGRGGAYPSDSVYDLAWAGAWLFKATGGLALTGRQGCRAAGRRRRCFAHSAAAPLPSLSASEKASLFLMRFKPLPPAPQASAPT